MQYSGSMTKSDKELKNPDQSQPAMGALSQENEGQEVSLAGWVHILRIQSKIAFLLLRNRQGIVQCVITKENSQLFEDVKKLSAESVVRVTGTMVKSEVAPGGHEIQATGLTVLSLADNNLPIPIVEKSGNPTDQSLRLDYRWLDLRKPEKLLIFEVWTVMEQAFRDYFLSQDFLEIHSPKLMSAPSESGAELFTVEYFERKAYLAQSPQFYKQMAMAGGLERVFEVGPVFRAEPSFTTRHATEFTGYDFEMSFIESHQDIINIWQEAIVAMVSAVQEKFGPAIKEFYGVDVVVPTLPFPSLTMAQAKAKLKSAGVTGDVSGDLNAEEEKVLGEIIEKEMEHQFVFVTDYPTSVRPFYHMRHSDNPELTRSFDLLFKGVEITTGAQREHRYDVLLGQAKEKGMNAEQLQSYLNFFKYGCPPHGGAGIGPGRIIMKLLNADNIREVAFLHRGVKRLTP